MTSLIIVKQIPKGGKSSRTSAKVFDPIILLAYILENALIIYIIELSDLICLQGGAGDAVLVIVMYWQLL